MTNLKQTAIGFVGAKKSLKKLNRITIDNTFGTIGGAESIKVISCPVIFVQLGQT